ncbi:type II toxin-antitoxin system YafQ family toxin [uncultured Duncaniella sp.]|jgi:mRNA interferase YafQ|uniref:type II toxin-antitoxin system YafQ family toxin n=1 Tax=uncultured Duncaniella sp. TaxID=2768039 RepID=UPI000F473FD0|nr:type II toxin-antitoxin system YafQ family toxin [uncultured Duncaniella sp.]ROS87288.1 type II toxin-antitoxin system YafQ family toxin [Muribaculaceae bacterium Isolate-080 (Janvier)]
MKELKLSGQFRKDLKRYKHQRDKLEALEHILGYLQRGEAIPQEYKPHMLSGDYKGHLECHVQNDLLLIWFDRTTDTVVLVRFGTHSELF